MFRISWLPGETRLLVQCRGFWEVSTAQSFRDEMHAGFAMAASARRSLEILSDMSDFAIQDGRVMQIFADVSLLLQRSAPTRHAVVMPSALQRLQGRRSLADNRYRTFEAIPPAAEWLEWPFGQLEPHLRGFDAAAPPIAAAGRR